MSTIVYQGLQSCLEPQVKETTTTLRLKLAAPKSIGILGSRNTKEVTENCHNENTTNQITSNPDLGGWNFLQSLSNPSQNPKKAMDIETTYVPSSLRLSQKSLEICTENLGSETGSDTSESSIFSFSSTDSWCEKSPTRERRQFSSAKKENSRSFPPPLTTISGSNSLQVRPHREGGRLIIEAVEAPSTRTYFEAERSHGRLKLRFLKNCEFMYDQKVTSDDINEENSHEDDNNNIGEFGNEEENICDENQKRDEGEFEEEEDYEEKSGANLKIVEGENGGAYMNKDMDGNRKDVEAEMGMEKFQRPSRCKEGGHGTDNGLCNWEPFWVATS